MFCESRWLIKEDAGTVAFISVFRFRQLNHSGVISHSRLILNSRHAAGTPVYAAVLLFLPWCMSSKSEPGIAGLLLRADTAGGTATEFRGSCVKHIRVRDWRNAQFKCNPVALWPLSGSWSFVFFSRLGAKCCRRERMRARIECVAEEKRSIPSSFPLVDHPVFCFFLQRDQRAVIGFRNDNLLGLPCLCPEGVCHVVSHTTPPSNPPIVASSSSSNVWLHPVLSTFAHAVVFSF